MKPKKILDSREHRPFPLPNRPWIMKQVWNDLLFAHWPVAAEDVLPYIPEGIQLDLWEGEPWLSLSPFTVTGLRLRGVPPLWPVSRFPELNARTYVVQDGKPGILFFSLDANKRPAVEAARTLGLPYLNARMSATSSGEWIRYRSARADARAGEAEFSASYRPLSERVFHAEPGTLLHWLTERYCLYTSERRGEVSRCVIHHLPWPLQEAELQLNANTIAESHGIQLPGRKPLLTYTKRLDVLFWGMESVVRV
ncbi:DUF2071 domain-containing protein [Saccharibacillus sp. CPCC 101409]|uniref:YqjF family protein n=1 Tax=Saccharibacillus sp. CPCC 101409 TaxID=3058041 RepID=UPI002673633B|nr:DUF2071 domain-containing protein [Saccharibacillus sp. CPCC 101409]MDO3408882.1 DUF2071 domain-containing protein [Saccharibacillus sp. CPCC 101409]